MQALKITIAESPDKAPHYARDNVDVRTAIIDHVIVVKNGTVAGEPTVDFQITAMDGSKFVAMLTGRLCCQLAQVIEAATKG